MAINTITRGSSLSDLSVKQQIAQWTPRPLDNAKTLSADFYCSPEIYRLEQKYVFGKAWFYVGHTSQLSEPGSFFTIEIAEQPLVILRSKEGDLRGFFNVCSHRAGPVAEGSGQCSWLVCPYHGWSFHLDGTLRNAPGITETCSEFDGGEHRLKSIQIETWGPFIFANLDPTAPALATEIGDIPAQFERYQFSNLARVHSADYWVDANWKIFAEITFDSYHEAVLHPTTLGRYYHCSKVTGEVKYDCYLQHAPLILDKNSQAVDPAFCIATLNEEEQKSFNMVCLFPNFVLVMGPDCCFTFQLDPQGVSKTRVRVDWLVPDTEAAKSPEHLELCIQFFDDLMQEDLSLMPLLQARISSLGFHQGQLCPKREMGVHLFQELLMRYLSHPMGG
jgi:phenylpropionate dioxygenase-like ring-hydroxylating dioxygenase large terminal subunit